MFELNEEEVRSNLAVVPNARVNYEQTLESLRTNLPWKIRAYRECKARLVGGPSISKELDSLLEDTRRQLFGWIMVDLRHIRILERVLSR
jgi:hypothetical protein